MSVGRVNQPPGFWDNLIKEANEAKNTVSNKAKAIVQTGKDVLDGKKKESDVAQEAVNKTVDGVAKLTKRTLKALRNESDHFNWIDYQDENDNVGRPRGLTDSDFAEYTNTTNNTSFKGSLANKIHLIRVVNIPSEDRNMFSRIEGQTKKFSDLCVPSKFGNIQYDPDDFLYCKNLGLPLNRMITLRRFPYPCTDNIYDRYNQAHPDMARMVTFFTDEVNKLDEILAFNYGLKWKELTSESEVVDGPENHGIVGGMLGRFLPFLDPIAAQNVLKGDPLKNFDPQHDQNKVYGPVDSIASTHIRDIGLNFDKEMSIVFEYELKSYGGRTPEYAMRDIIGNVLATTFNNAKFWGGARIWRGDRPTKYLSTLQGILNPTTIDGYLHKARKGVQGILADLFGNHGGSKIQALKNALGTVLKNAMTYGLGKILDEVGRAAIPQMNSLLSGEPVGHWHVTVGHPEDPIMCIGNLLLDSVDIKFPSDELSYGNFPTRLEVVVKLKPGMPKDRAQIETMFNMGRQRLYHNPKKIKIHKNNKTELNPANRRKRVFTPDYDDNMIQHMFDETYDFRELEYVDKAKGSGAKTGTHMEVTVDDVNLNYTYQTPDLEKIAKDNGFEAAGQKLDSFVAQQNASQNYQPVGGNYGGSFGSGTSYAAGVTYTMNGSELVNNDHIKGKTGISDAKLEQVANIAASRAGANSKQACAAYVNQAFAQAGLGNIFKKGHAYEKEATLRAAGFAELPANTKPKIGDVIVIRRGPKSNPTYGHVAVYTKDGWVSDFKQKGPNVYRSRGMTDADMMKYAVIFRA